MVKSVQIVATIISGGIAASKADMTGTGLSATGFVLAILDAEKVPLGKAASEAIPVAGLFISGAAVGVDIFGSDTYKSCRNGDQ